MTIGIGVNIDKAPDINRQVICMKDLGFEFENPNDFLNILMAKFESYIHNGNQTIISLNSKRLDASCI